MLKKFSFILVVLMALIVLSHTGVGSHPLVSTIMQPFKIDPALATEEVTWRDSDGDGCADHEELGTDFTKGGLRDPNNPWDFYDINGNGHGQPDGKVDGMDAQDLAFRWMSRQGDPWYSARVDRSVTSSGLGPPDGVIDIHDLQAAYSQLTDTCQGSTTTQLTQIAPLCDGNLKEAGDAAGAALVPGKTYKECRLVRDTTGKLVDVDIVDETTAITDVAYSSDPVVPSQVQQGIAPKAPSPGSAGSEIGPQVWEFGCVTGHNRAYSFWGYTLYDLALKECFAAVIDPSNIYYGVTLENGKDYWNPSAYPYTLTSGEFDPAWDQPARWNVYGFDFQRERWGDVSFHPCCQNWTTRTLHIGVRIFWATNRQDYDPDFSSGPGVLGQLLY